MPLSLSRTTRSFNSWAPSGGEGIQGVFKKDVDSFDSVAPSARSYTPQRVIRTEPLPVVLELNGFKPEQQEQKPIEQSSALETNHVSPAVLKAPLRRGRRGHKPHHFTDPNLPLRHVCANASVEVGSALMVTRSPQSLAHLRKWNSQLHLDAVFKDSQGRGGRPSEYLSPVKRQALQWNVSLPDIREAVKAERQRLRRPRRQETLLRTPSDVGRTLAFWIRDGEGEGHVESFDVLSQRHRSKYKHKLSLLRTYISTKSGNRNVNVVSLNDDNQMENLSAFSPHVLAQELTLLDREMLLAVETAELVTLVMRPLAADEESCPNLSRLVHFYERMAALVVTEILASGDASTRAQILSTFVETADLCRVHNNRQSTAALMAGIRSPPVVRLRQTWTRLRNEYPDHYSKYEALVTCTAEGDHRQLNSVAAFAEILARLRGRPTVTRTRPRRPLWKEPPSLARWVEEQTTVPPSCDTCVSSGGHHPCCYLLVFVLGRNLFCPVRKMPPEGSEIEAVQQQQQVNGFGGDSRVRLAKSFDDPDSLPFASKHIQCCALQPQSQPDVLRRAEISLRSAQAAARVYDFAVNKSARHYLLNKPYSSGSENMNRSLQVESKRTTRFGIS